MIARVITTLLLLLGATAGGYGLIKYEASKDTTAPTVAPSSLALSNAWIEVEQGTVFRRSVGQGTPLKSGDTVSAGDTLETAKNTSAIVHFPDGSVLRLDKETSVTLSNFSYAPEDKSLVVEIQLLSGRLWSKVVGLATPASRWQVKTSNTVATVRGTAFGMGYKNNKSWVLGSEHTVSVAPLDPTTKLPLPHAEIPISEKAYIEIGEKEVALARATSSPVLLTKVSTTSNPFSQDIWIKKVKADDEELNAEIKTTKESQTNKEEKVWRAALEEQVAKQLYKIAPEKAKQEDRDTKETKDTSPTSNEPKAATIPPSTSASSQIGGPTADTKSGSTFRISVLPFGGHGSPTEPEKVSLSEGETQVFHAWMEQLNSKGERIGADDITEQVEFKVLGDIGSINEKGLFTAKLGDSVSENGKAYGGIVATLKNASASSLPSSGKSVIIEVISKAPSLTPTDIGGQ